MTQSNSVNTQEKPEAGNEIREYITPASKRGAAISSTLSFIIILKAFGAIPSTEIIQLPIINLPITDFAAAILLPAMALVVFCMWNIRYLYESLYTGTVRQERTKSLRAELDYHAKGNLNGIANLADKEEQFRKRLSTEAAHYQSAWNYNESARPGFQMSLTIGRLERGLTNDMWNDLEKTRDVFSDYEETYTEKLKSYNDILAIDNRLSLVSRISYVWTPIALFLAAITSLIWRYMPEVIGVMFSSA